MLYSTCVNLAGNDFANIKSKQPQLDVDLINNAVHTLNGTRCTVL